MAAALRQRYGRDRVTVVVSRYDSVAEIGRKEIERVMGGPIVQVFPSDYRLALGAMNVGRPLVLDNHNKLAASFPKLDALYACICDTACPTQCKTECGN